MEGTCGAGRRVTVGLGLTVPVGVCAGCDTPWTRGAPLGWDALGIRRLLVAWDTSCPWVGHVPPVGHAPTTGPGLPLSPQGLGPAVPPRPGTGPAPIAPVSQ